MATGAAITNYIDLTNFTPGIASGWGGIATPGDGTTAQIAETWGCFGLPEGGLGPLPRLKSTITGSPMATVTAPPADYSTDLRIHDILAVPNFRTPNTAGSAEWHDSTLSTREQDMVMVVVEKFATVSGVTRKLMTGHLYNAQTNSWESDSTELVIRADADGTISNTWGSGAALAIRASPGATNQISNPSAQAFDVDSSRYQSILISWHTSWNYNWLFAGVGFFTDPVYGYKLGAGSGVENDIWEGGTYMWDNLARYTYPHASPPTTFNGWPMGVSRAFYHQGRLCYPASKLARGGNIFTNRPEGIYDDGAWARSWDDTTLVFHAPKGPQSLDGDDLAGAPRRSRWTALLEKLYDATVNENKVPRNEAGELMFIKVGSFTNVNGARTQARALEQKGFDQTYEFKSVTREGGSDLFARVIETDDAAVEAEGE